MGLMAASLWQEAFSGGAGRHHRVVLGTLCASLGEGCTIRGSVLLLWREQGAQDSLHNIAKDVAPSLLYCWVLSQVWMCMRSVLGYTRLSVQLLDAYSLSVAPVP